MPSVDQRPMTAVAECERTAPSGLTPGSSSSACWWKMAPVSDTSPGISRLARGGLPSTGSPKSALTRSGHAVMPRAERSIGNAPNQAIVLLKPASTKALAGGGGDTLTLKTWPSCGRLAATSCELSVLPGQPDPDQLKPPDANMATVKSLPAAIWVNVSPGASVGRLVWLFPLSPHATIEPSLRRATLCRSPAAIAT